MFEPVALIGIGGGLLSVGLAVKIVLFPSSSNLLSDSECKSSSQGSGHVTERIIGVPIVASTSKEQEITYRELAMWLWNRPDNESDQIEVLFDRLATGLWSNPIQVDPVEVIKPTFVHHEIEVFYDTKVVGRRYVAGAVLQAVEEILLYLDEHGNCSSLASFHSREWAKTAHQKSMDIYAQVDLWEHSIHVAEAMIHLTETDDLLPLTAKGIIAALGHDLGKIPKYYDKYKHSEPHQIASIGCLEAMKYVTALPSWPEIREAVQLHHDRSNSQLAKYLAEADQMARRRELNEYIDHDGALRDNQPRTSLPSKIPSPKVPSDQSVFDFNVSSAISDTANPANSSPATEIPQYEPEPATCTVAPVVDPPPVITVIKEDDPEQMQEEPSLEAVSLPALEKQSSKRHQPTGVVNVNTWLTDPEHLVTYIGQYVNGRVPGGDEASPWSSVLKDGFVYFKPKDFVRLIQQYAQGHKDVEDKLVNQQSIDNLLYAIVKKLESNTDAIASQYLKKMRFASKFLVHIKGQEHSRPQYFIPFNAKAFSLRFAEIDKKNQKTTIKNIEKIVWMEG